MSQAWCSVCSVAVNSLLCVTGEDAEAQKVLIAGFRDHGTASESRRLVLTLVARIYPPRSLLREGKPQSRCCLCLTVCPAEVSELPWAWRGKSSRPVPPQSKRGSSGAVGTGPGHTGSCPPSPLGASPLMRGDLGDPACSKLLSGESVG